MAAVQQIMAVIMEDFTTHIIAIILEHIPTRTMDIMEDDIIINHLTTYYMGEHFYQKH